MSKRNRISPIRSEKRTLLTRLVHDKMAKVWSRSRRNSAILGSYWKSVLNLAKTITQRQAQLGEISGLSCHHSLSQGRKLPDSWLADPPHPHSYIPVPCWTIFDSVVTWCLCLKHVPIRHLCYTIGGLLELLNTW